VLACSGGATRDPPTSLDAAPDAQSDAGPIEPPAPAVPAPPVPAPCPAGWRETPDPDLPAIATCVPWGGEAPQDCAPDETHWPDAPGCERIGPACPAGDWPVDLPAGAIHVRAGEPAGGDGTAERPFGLAADGLAAASDGDVVALSRGRFEEAVTVRGAVTLRGACVGGTVVASPVPAELEATIALVRGAAVRDLTVSGERLGIRANPSADRATVRSVVVDGADAIGIIAAGTPVLLEEVVVRATRGGSSGGFGYGLDVEAGGDVEVDRVSLERNRGVALIVGSSSLRGTDLTLRDTLPRRTDARAGYGMQVLEGSSLEVARLVAHRNRGIAVAIVGPDTAARVTDAWIADTLAQEADGLVGLGLDAFGGSQVEVERATFVANRTLGVSAAEPGTVLTATDVVIADTLEQQADGSGGYGVEVFLGGRVQIVRGALVHNRVASVFVDGEGTTFDAADLLVYGTIAPPGGRDPGLGVQARTGADATIRRGRVDRSAGIGVVAYGAGATLTLRDVAVERTAALSGEEGGGSGVIALEGGAVDAAVFRIADNDFCGVQLAGEGVVDLHDGVVSGNLVGANVQTAGFDLTRLQDGVVFRDNVRDLDAEALPLPSPP
jgi:nitrous oxidase accessory protein NosD